MCCCNSHDTQSDAIALPPHPSLAAGAAVDVLAAGGGSCSCKLQELWRSIPSDEASAAEAEMMWAGRLT